jgi:DNA-binding transcriptional ArsR family regulator
MTEDLALLFKALADPTRREILDRLRERPRDFYAGQNARDFLLEPHLGGRMYEDWGNGGGAIWYVVTEIDPPRSLGLSGQMPAAFGGPATFLLRLVLRPEGEETVLELTDSEFRRPTRPTEKALASLEEGWRALFEKAFKSYVEERPLPPS